MTPEFLSALAGSALSLAAAYVPGVSGWYAGLDGVRKRLVMLGLLAGAALACYAAACSRLAVRLEWPPLTCGADGAATVARAFITALAANQATFLIGAPSGAPGGTTSGTPTRQ
jgi:hypothetical protein